MFIHRGESFGSQGSSSGSSSGRRARIPDIIIREDYSPLPCIQVTQVSQGTQVSQVTQVSQGDEGWGVLEGMGLCVVNISQVNYRYKFTYGQYSPEGDGYNKTSISMQ